MTTAEKRQLLKSFFCACHEFLLILDLQRIKETFQNDEFVDIYTIFPPENYTKSNFYTKLQQELSGKIEQISMTLALAATARVLKFERMRLTSFDYEAVAKDLSKIKLPKSLLKDFNPFLTILENYPPAARYFSAQQIKKYVKNPLFNALV